MKRLIRFARSLMAPSPAWNARVDAWAARQQASIRAWGERKQGAIARRRATLKAELQDQATEIHEQAERAAARHDAEGPAHEFARRVALLNLLRETGAITAEEFDAKRSALVEAIGE